MNNPLIVNIYEVLNLLDLYIFLNCVFATLLHKWLLEVGGDSKSVGQVSIQQFNTQSYQSEDSFLLAPGRLLGDLSPFFSGWFQSDSLSLSGPNKFYIHVNCIHVSPV